MLAGVVAVLVGVVAPDLGFVAVLWGAGGVLATVTVLVCEPQPASSAAPHALTASMAVTGGVRLITPMVFADPRPAP